MHLSLGIRTSNYRDRLTYPYSLVRIREPRISTVCCGEVSPSQQYCFLVQDKTIIFYSVVRRDEQFYISNEERVQMLTKER